MAAELSHSYLHTKLMRAKQISKSCKGNVVQDSLSKNGLKNNNNTNPIFAYILYAVNTLGKISSSQSLSNDGGSLHVPVIQLNMKQILKLNCYFD